MLLNRCLSCSKNPQPQALSHQRKKKKKRASLSYLWHYHLKHPMGNVAINPESVKNTNPSVIIEFIALPGPSPSRPPLSTSPPHPCQPVPRRVPLQATQADRAQTHSAASSQASYYKDEKISVFFFFFLSTRNSRAI